MILIADIEANGMLEEADTIWTIQVKPPREEDWKYSYRWDKGNIHSCLMRLSNAEVIVGHNWLGYDEPLLEKLCNFKRKGRVLDTLVLSRLLYPDRKGHSLEEWGKRIGFGKGDYQDFSQFSEEMVRYCRKDVRITEKITNYLLEEIGIEGDMDLASAIRTAVS